MAIIDTMRAYILKLIISNLIIDISPATPSFYLSFRRSDTLSKEEWAAFLGPMPDLKEFSVCHWDKPKYFNDQINAVWNYCIRTQEMKKIDCFGLDKMLLSSTANRQMEVSFLESMFT